MATQNTYMQIFTTGKCNFNGIGCRQAGQAEVETESKISPPPHPMPTSITPPLTSCDLMVVLRFLFLYTSASSSARASS